MYISTSIWVQRTPNAVQNLHFNIFNSKKLKKEKFEEKLGKKLVFLNEGFDQRLGCTAPKRQSKYTTYYNVCKSEAGCINEQTQVFYIYPQNQGFTHALQAQYKALQPDPIKGLHTIPLLGSWLFIAMC